MANVTVQKDRYTVDSVYQWDKDQELVIYGLSLATIPEIHFTNDAMDKAIVRQSTMDDAGVITAEIPNSLLQKPYKIRAYVCIYEGETFKSLYLITIPVEARSMPNDYTLTVSDEEVYSFNALENLIINTVTSNEKLSAEVVASNQALQANLTASYNSAVTEIKSSNQTLENNIKESNTTLENNLLTEFNTISKDTVQECETNISETTTELSARLDNIIVHNNDTEGNTELLDIRVGADGTVYESAGKAVRQPITPARTTFFEKKQIGDVVETYTPIVESDVFVNENYSQTNGYYINMCSTTYSALRMTEDTSKVAIFRKVKAGEKVVLRGMPLALDQSCFISEDIYNLLMSGYQADISSQVDWANIVDATVTKITIGQIRSDLTPNLGEIWPDKGSYYAYEQAFNEAPFNGYLFLGKSLNLLTSISNFPNYEYSTEIIYGYTLEKTLKTDPFIGEKMSTLLGLDFKEHFPRQSKFNFTPLTGAITVNTDGTATLEKLADPLGTLQYVGGICANKKIYMAPNTASQIMVYDTVNDYYYFIGSGLGDQAFKYTGWVAYGGYLYSIPRGVNNLLRVDPVTDEVTIIDLDTEYPITPYGDYRDSHHYNGVISDNGYMYSPPAYSSDKLLKINMNDFTSEELDFTSEDVSTWIGCIKHPTEDKIIFLSTKVFRVWNCEDDTYIDIVSETERSCYDMVYDPRYDCFIGIYPNHIFALKLSDYTLIDSDYINYMSTGYGVTLGLDGAIYHLEGASAYKFFFDGSAFTQEATITTSENIGSVTPYLAGQAIDNEGNIYGIPGSGALVRLKFSKLTRGVPDYIVSSQYYGKY